MREEKRRKKRRGKENRRGEEIRCEEKQRGEERGREGEEDERGEREGEERLHTAEAHSAAYAVAQNLCLRDLPPLLQRGLLTHNSDFNIIMSPPPLALLFFLLFGDI